MPVIAYDRLIEDQDALYLTFDNQSVGKLQAQEIFERVPKGNYVIIKGNKADANADFLRAGYEEVIGDAVKSGDIKIVGETYTDNWDPAKAQTEMEQFLTANDNKVDAVLVGERRHGRRRRRRPRRRRASPARCRCPARTATGRPSTASPSAPRRVDVWKDARLLGKTAGEAAIQLCKDKDASKVSGTAPFTTPGGIEVSSILLTPQTDHPGQPRTW